MERDDVQGKSRTTLSASESKSIYWASLVGAIVTGVSALVAVILVAASDSFSLDLIVTSDYRIGLKKDDDFPTAPILTGRNADVAWMAAFISVLGFVSLLLMTLFWRNVTVQMSLGGNPFIWALGGIWQWLLFVILALFSGVTNVFVLVYTALTVLSWLSFFWDGDLLSAPAYQRIVEANNNGLRGSWFWGSLPLWRAVAWHIVVYVINIIYLAQTFGQSPNSPSGWYLAASLAVHILYLGLPLITVAGYWKWFFTSVYYRDFWMIVYSTFLIVASTWIFLGVTTVTP